MAASAFWAAAIEPAEGVNVLLFRVPWKLLSKVPYKAFRSASSDASSISNCSNGERDVGSAPAVLFLAAICARVGTVELFAVPLIMSKGDVAASWLCVMPIR